MEKLRRDRPLLPVISDSMTDQPQPFAARPPEPVAAEPVAAETVSPDDGAMRWLMRVSDPGAGADVHAACLRWRALDPAHDAAFIAAQRFWQRDELALALEYGLRAPKPRGRPQSQSWPRRLWPFGLAMAAVLALAILAGGAYLLPQVRQFGSWALADQRAPLHAMASVRLDDGSRVTLDAGAAFDISYSGTERRLVLRRGTIVVDATPDAARPMVVETAAARVTVLGTRFLVARGLQSDRIDVQAGRVAVRGSSGEEVRLTAGQRVTVDAAGPGTIAAMDPNSVADFAAGWRSFEGAPLQTVLDEIGRYRLAPVLLMDGSLAAMPVTARLQVSEPERAIGALLASMPLRMQEWPGGALRIDHRR